MKKVAPFLEMVHNIDSFETKPEGFPSVKTKADKLSDIDANTIYQYLINGIKIIEFLSSEKDIYDHRVSVPTKVFTDGSYVWTMMIPHLVKNYNVSLPKEFINHINKQSKYANQYNKNSIDQILESLKGKRINDYLKFDVDE